MKRYVCTVAAGLVLALASAGAATASGGLPLLGGQSGTQVTDFGDQSVGEQKNDADVTQEQGNGNINIAPAIAIFGDAETTNEQGNDNTAIAEVDQENDVDQTQSSNQHQSLDSGDSNGCCSGQSQTGEQRTYGGDQSVDKQENDADVTQEQGNGNINIAPAIAILGDAETTNEQGNDNTAIAEVDQENDVDQSQSSTQNQHITGDGGSCCESKNDYGKNDYGKTECCDSGQSQAGEQKTSFGDQYVGEQKNDADVTQKQGNDNVNIAPAIAIFGDAETTNKQGNGNYAEADVDQKNDVDQSQDSYQRQSLEQSGEAGRKGCCSNGSTQTGEQRVYGGDQSVEKQENDADVTQKQGNENESFAPAIAVFGDAETTNYQGNGNVAKADIDQKNDVDQSQSSTQKQELTQEGGGCCEPKKDYGNHGYVKEECCDDGQSQAGEQKTSFGDQYVGEQKNDADVTQKQGNENESFAPAIALGGGRTNSCNSTCGNSWHPVGGNASTRNYQGNGNVAKADIDQKNDVDQSQSSTQKQELTQEGGGCCEPKKDYGRKHSSDCSSKCEPKKEYEPKERCCDTGHDQTGEQKVRFGDQYVGKQKNDADVTQKQGNRNESFAPAVAFGGARKDSCGSTCGKTWHPRGGGASTTNKQGNGNEAKAYVDQKNSVDQKQTSYQRQGLVDKCKGLINR